jgi:DNA-binding transcriptional LysR family regulator
MDQLDAIRLLLATLDEGSLAKGGRKLSRSPAAVSRAIAGLEESAGELLLHRSSRGLKLTAAGERHVATYRQVLSDLDQLKPERKRPHDMRGLVRVTAPEMFGRLNVLPITQNFQERYPGVSVAMYFQNRLTDLVEEGIDVAVRLAELPDSSLSAVRVGAMRRLVCASPKYLARMATPDRPSDLRTHQCIGRNVGGISDVWTFNFRKSGKARLRSQAVPSRIAVSSVAAALDVARSGGGIGQFMAYQVLKDIAAGRLVRLLIPYELEPAPVNLVFHGGFRANGCVRAFIDHATPLLRHKLADIQRALD